MPFVPMVRLLSDPWKASALRRGSQAWQLLRANASHSAMTRSLNMQPFALIAATVMLSATGCATSTPPPYVPGGAIATLPLGTYACELPGDAGGAAGIVQVDYAFRIVNSSSYKADDIRGSYLLVGDYVTMTGGKLKGLKLHRISSTFLRQVQPDGTDGQLRCVLTAHY